MRLIIDNVEKAVGAVAWTQRWNFLQTQRLNTLLIGSRLLPCSTPTLQLLVAVSGSSTVSAVWYWCGAHNHAATRLQRVRRQNELSKHVLSITLQRRRALTLTTTKAEHPPIKDCFYSAILQNLWTSKYIPIFQRYAQTWDSSSHAIVFVDGTHAKLSHVWAGSIALTLPVHNTKHGSTMVWCTRANQSRQLCSCGLANGGSDDGGDDAGVGCGCSIMVIVRVVVLWWWQQWWCKFYNGSGGSNSAVVVVILQWWCWWWW